jgi:hypothetical protein
MYGVHVCVLTFLTGGRRNAQSVVQAIEQLADANERIQEGERQFKNDIKRIVEMCGGVYPDISFVEPLLRQEQSRIIDAAQRRTGDYLQHGGRFSGTVFAIKLTALSN